MLRAAYQGTCTLGSVLPAIARVLGSRGGLCSSWMGLAVRPDGRGSAREGAELAEEGVHGSVLARIGEIISNDRSLRFFKLNGLERGQEAKIPPPKSRASSPIDGNSVSELTRCAPQEMAADFSYWSLDQILAEDERVKTTVIEGAVNLGWLDPSAGTDNLPAESKVELPLWMATHLKSLKLAHVVVPKFLNLQIRTTVMSDPAQFDLRNLSPHYYEVAAQIIRHMTPPANPAMTDLYPATVYTFIARVADIIAHAENCRDETFNEYRDRLTDLEQNLFSRGCDYTRDTIRWRRRELEKLTASTTGGQGVRVPPLKRRAVTPDP